MTCHGPIASFNSEISWPDGRRRDSHGHCCVEQACLQAAAAPLEEISLGLRGYASWESQGHMCYDGVWWVGSTTEHLVGLCCVKVYQHADWG